MSQIAASVQDFLRTGEFGPMRFGFTHRQLRGCLGEPEQWGPAPRAQHNAGVWKHGDIEFHFSKDTLWLIFADNISALKGGQAIDLNPWIFHGGLLAADALEHLAAAAIPFERIHWMLDDDTERYRVGAGVELIFADETQSLFCDGGIAPDARPGMTFDGFPFSASAQAVTP